MRIPLLTYSAWLLLLVTCTSVGLYVQQRFIRRALTWEAALEAFWIGWALSIVMLQLWHFVLPITKLTLSVFSLIALICAYLLRTSLRTILPTMVSSWRKGVLYGLLLVLVTFWLITRTMFSASIYDHALYYLQTEKWFSTYPIVPGLGNLHGRLAFNSSYLLYTSLFQTWFGLPRAFHVGNGLLMLALLLQVVYGIGRIRWSGGGVRLWQWFCLLSLVPVLQQLVVNWRIGWSNDFAIFVLGIVMTIQVLKLLETDENSSAEIFYRLCLLTLLAVVGITIKLTFVVWGGALLAGLLIAYRHTLFARPEIWRRVSLGIAIVSVALIPWVGRNIILSGYLIYPAAASTLPVAWRIPTSVAVAQAQAIYGWARLSNVNYLTTLNNWDWLGGWFQHLTAQTFEVILPFVLAVIALIRIAAFRSKSRQPIKFLWIIPLIASLSLVYWFLTAPDVRFAGALFWLLANGLLLIALTTIPEKRRLVPICAIVIMSALVGLTDTGAFTERGEANAPMDTPPLQEITIGSDTISAPITGDRCGNAPIPCAPGIPNSRLRLRTPGKLADGFWIAQE